MCTRTRERRLHRVCGLAFQSREKKRGLFFDMLIDISLEIEFLSENVRLSVEVVLKVKLRPQITI